MTQAGLSLEDELFELVSCPRSFRVVRQGCLNVVAFGVQFADGTVAVQQPGQSVWDSLRALLTEVEKDCPVAVEWAVPPNPRREPADFEYPLSTGKRVPAAGVDALCVACHGAWPCTRCPDPFGP